MHGNSLKLKGLRFGRLVAIEPIKGARKDNKILWFCECDCGKTTVVKSTDLKRGHTKSCGCLQIEAAKTIRNIAGEKFGRLTAVEFAGSYKNGGSLWLCECECGARKIIALSAISQALTQSCGCLHKEIMKSSNKGPNAWREEHDSKEGTSLALLTNKEYKSNTSGTKGVYYRKDTNSWRALLTFKGERFDLGTYKNKGDAIAARKAAEEKYFKPILQKYGKETEAEH